MTMVMLFQIMPWLRVTPNAATDSILNILICMIMLFNCPSPEEEEDEDGDHLPLLEDTASVERIQANFIKVSEKTPRFKRRHSLLQEALLALM
jgi:hypothetical protein